MSLVTYIGGILESYKNTALYAYPPLRKILWTHLCLFLRWMLFFAQKCDICVHTMVSKVHGWLTHDFCALSDVGNLITARRLFLSGIVIFRHFY